MWLCIALWRTNTKNSKQIFPEKEFRGHNRTFHSHVSVRYLYITTINLPILPQEICEPILEVCINSSQANECGNRDWGRAVPRKGIHKWDFRCSVWFAYESMTRMLLVTHLLFLLVPYNHCTAALCFEMDRAFFGYHWYVWVFICKCFNFQIIPQKNYFILRTPRT